MFSSDGPEARGSQQAIEQVTGCGLAWQEFAQANGQPGAAAVYTAFAPKLVNNCQLSGTLRYSADGMIAVVSFSNAAANLGTADVRSVYGDAGLGSVNVLVDGSLVYQIGHNWSFAAEPTPAGLDTSTPPRPTPASLFGTYLSEKGDTSWVMRLDKPQSANSLGAAMIVAQFPESGMINTVSFMVLPSN